MANYRMGWLPDRPDFRDYSIKEFIKEYNKQKGNYEIELFTAILLADDSLKIDDGTSDQEKEQVRLVLPIRKLENLLYLIQYDLPKSIDLRQWLSPIKDQGQLDSCTAQAGIALVEYFERKVMGEYLDASSLFLYKVARNLMQLTGDTGASMRFTMKAMVLFGVPPEEYWPYNIETFDQEPSTFCYAYAQNYQALHYFRLDLPHLSKKQLLIQIKVFLAAELPVMFGFTAYSSLFNRTVLKTGKIPYPSKGEKVLGGHAVVAVGYDDYKIIQHPTENNVRVGAVLIRNCWGENWGEDGYGWLPYDYVLNGLATDWWSLLKNEWVDEWQFTIAPNSILLVTDLVTGDPNDKVPPTVPK